MKSLFSQLILGVLSVLLIGCSRTRNSENNDPSSLRAAIAEICNSTINFVDLDENVYAYRADDLFFVPSIQTGGHSTATEISDLGANIFAALPIELNIVGTFLIDEGTANPGTAYIFYIDESGTEYTSTSSNTGILTVQNIDISEDGSEINSLMFSFNNVEVANIIDFEDKLCINAFELIYNNSR